MTLLCRIAKLEAASAPALCKPLPLPEAARQRVMELIQRAWRNRHDETWRELADDVVAVKRQFGATGEPRASWFGIRGEDD